jgi:hypothetical protein
MKDTAAVLRSSFPYAKLSIGPFGQNQIREKREDRIDGRSDIREKDEVTLEGWG